MTPEEFWWLYEEPASDLPSSDWLKEMQEKFPDKKPTEGVSNGDND